MAGRGNRPKEHLSGVTAVVAEDEKALREELEARLSTLWPDLHVVASVDNGIDALTMFERHRPQLMFLDIQMPGLTGLEVAQQVAERCHVIFITAYDSYAVTAFQNGAVDYVLKPYDLNRLGQTIRRLQQRMGSPPPVITEILKEIAASAHPKTNLNWIKASNGNEVSLIPVREILYFRAESKYTNVVTASQEFIIRRSVKELVADLDSNHFWQIHRSTIVNVEAISSVMRSIAGETMLKLKGRSERLAVSEAHRHLFKHM